ncbi:hypothetical protein LXL04_028497 [Taraxacum kok-saghyz]
MEIGFVVYLGGKSELRKVKDVKVYQRIGRDQTSWDRRRATRGGREQVEEEEIHRLINQTTLSEEKDRWIIPNAYNEEYSTRWLREKIMESQSLNTNNFNSWIKWVPKKINILLWRVLRDRLPVREILKEFNVNIQDVSCPVCKKEAESVSHLFLKCEMASHFWARFGFWWKVPIPIFDSMLHMWRWTDSLNIPKRRQKEMKVMISAMIKVLWDYRNGKLYKNKDKDKDFAFKGAQEMAFLWLSRVAIESCRVGFVSCQDTKRRCVTHEINRNTRKEGDTYLEFSRSCRRCSIKLEEEEERQIGSSRKSPIEEQERQKNGRRTAQSNQGAIAGEEGERGEATGEELEPERRRRTANRKQMQVAAKSPRERNFTGDWRLNNLNVNQLNAIEELKRRISNVQLSNRSDKWRCTNTEDGLYRVANLGRLSTVDALLKRGIPVESRICSHCAVEDEDVIHVLWQCSFAKTVWYWIFKWCEVPIPAIDEVADLIRFLNTRGHNQMRRKTLISICYGTLWMIWNARCDWVFKKRRISPSKVADNIKSVVYTWLKYRRNKCDFKWENWSVEGNM